MRAWYWYRLVVYVWMRHVYMGMRTTNRESILFTARRFQFQARRNENLGLVDTVFEK